MFGVFRLRFKNSCCIQVIIPLVQPRSALTLPFKKSLLISLQKYFIQPTDKPKHSIHIYRRRKHRFAYLFKFGGVVNLCLYLKYKVVAAVGAVFSPFYRACLINIQGALWSVLEHKTHGLACVECIPSLIKHLKKSLKSSTFVSV